MIIVLCDMYSWPNTEYLGYLFKDVQMKYSLKHSEQRVQEESSENKDTWQIRFNKENYEIVLWKGLCFHEKLKEQGEHECLYTILWKSWDIERFSITNGNVGNKKTWHIIP